MAGHGGAGPRGRDGRRRPARVVGVASYLVWCAVLVALGLTLARWSPASPTSLASTDPTDLLRAVAIGARWAALAATAYLLLATALTTVAEVTRAGPLRRISAAVSVPVVRRVVRAGVGATLVVGIGLGPAAAAAAAPSPPGASAARAAVGDPPSSASSDAAAASPPAGSSEVPPRDASRQAPPARQLDADTPEPAAPRADHAGDRDRADPAPDDEPSPNDGPGADRPAPGGGRVGGAAGAGPPAEDARDLAVRERAAPDRAGPARGAPDHEAPEHVASDRVAAPDGEASDSAASAEGRPPPGATPGASDGPARPSPAPPAAHPGSSTTVAEDPDEAPGPMPVAEVGAAEDLAAPAGRAGGEADEHVVVAGESFWTIASDLLVAGSDDGSAPPSDADIVPVWRALIEANRDRLEVPDDPDLLFPGQRLTVPVDARARS